MSEPALGASAVAALASALLLLTAACASEAPPRGQAPSAPGPPRVLMPGVSPTDRDPDRAGSGDNTGGPVAPGAPAGARLLFLGDTSFGEIYQERLAARGGEDVLAVRGHGHMLGGLAPILAGAALVAANLETPLTDLPASPLAGRKGYVHRGDPATTPRHLAAHGVGLVSLGNNHAMDYGAAGLAQTEAALAGRGIATCGAGADAARAREPFRHVVDLGGGAAFRVAVLCGFEYSHAYDRGYGFYAGDRRPGVNPLSPRTVAAQVRALRREAPGVLAVAFPHWGPNYRPVSANQRRLGRALVDAGVDLVLGHGAHALQGLERYRSRWIVYSLGNFVFGSPGRYALFGAPPYSLIAELALETRRDGAASGGVAKALRLYPIVTDNLVTGYRGRFATAGEFDAAAALLAGRSPVGAGGFNAVVRRDRDRHGRRYLELRLE